jgi:hypothetical protein
MLTCGSRAATTDGGRPRKGGAALVCFEAGDAARLKYVAGRGCGCRCLNQCAAHTCRLSIAYSLCSIHALYLCTLYHRLANILSTHNEMSPHTCVLLEKTRNFFALVPCSHLVSKVRAGVVLTVAEALAWYLIHPYDERNLYLSLPLPTTHLPSSVPTRPPPAF